MSVAEEVLITIKAKDEVSSVLTKIRTEIDNLGKSFNKSMPKGSDFAKGFNMGMKDVGASFNVATNSMKGFGDLSQATGSKANMTFTEAAATMDKYHVGLNRVTNAMTGLFGTMGLFGMAHESWMFATQRQTNQIYLQMRRGTEEAHNMYNEIMHIVMELPGDDTFLTTILTQASGRDLSMSVDGIRKLGDAVADYYVAATAKGQLSYETQRELTSYILTGETRMFTNSVLADEIELLKNKNTVTERANALQEALNRTGFEGMAHYESATNSMEEFKGHFQKAFADLGSMALPIIQGVLGIYNAIDGLTNTTISAGIISVATAVALFTTALGTIGFITPMVNEGIVSLIQFGGVIRNMRSGFIESGGAIRYFADHISGLITTAKASITPLEEMMTVTSVKDTFKPVTIPTLGKTVNYEGYLLENGAILSNTELKLQNLIATTRLSEQQLALLITQEGLTYEEYLNSVGLDANTMSKLANVSASMDMSEAELLELAVKSDMTTAEFLETLAINLNSVETDLNSASKQLNANAEALEIDVKNIGITSTIRSIYYKVIDSATNLYHAITSYIKGDAEAFEDAVQKSIFLTTLSNIYTKLTSGATNLWEAFTVVTVADAKIVENTVEQNSIITKWWNIVTTITEADANSWEAISEFFSADSKLFNGLSSLFSGDAKILDTLATLGLNVATWLLNGALGVLQILLSPISLTILAIVGAVILLIWGFEQLGKAFGWWEDIGGMFDAIQSGLQRIWDAFVNSEPVQQIITTFQNLWYTLETLFNFLGTIGGGLWELIFGVDDGSSSGAFDIVGLLLEIGGAIGNFLYWLSPIEEILAIFDALGSYIAWCLDTWNEFIDSAEMQGLIKSFQELRDAFGKVWGEISDAFADIGEAFGSLFAEDDGSTEEVVDSGNAFLDVLKGIATFIDTVVIPIIGALLIPLRLIATIIRTIADAVSWFVGIFTGATDVVGGLSDAIVNEFANIPSRILGMVSGLPNQVFGGLVDGVLNILGIHSPGYIQEAVVGEFLGIPSRILGGLGNITSAVGNFASSIWQGFDNIFGTHMSDTVDGFFNRLSQSFHKLSKGDIIGVVKDFGNDFLNAISGIFGTDVGNMVGGFFSQISSNVNKLMSGDILGAIEDSNNFLNDSIKRFTGIDLNSIFENFKGNGVSGTMDVLTKNTSPEEMAQQQAVLNDMSSRIGADNIFRGLMNNPQNLATSQTLTQNYNSATNHSPTIVNNNFGEGSVQADARNMSAKDVQNMFTGAFGYNKSRGTTGIIR